MKKILFTLAMLISVAYGQSTLYLRGDSVMLQKTNGNSELIILNGSRTVTNGILTNIGNGRTRFLPIDSFSVGGTLNNIGSGFDLAVEGTSSVKSLAASNGITADTLTEGTVGVKLGGTLTDTTTIDAAGLGMRFNWPTLSSGTGMRLRAHTTAAAGDTSRVLSVVAGGVNAIGSRTTTGIYVANTHTGAGLSGTKSFGLDVLVGDTTATNGKVTVPVGMRIKTHGVGATGYEGSLMIERIHPGGSGYLNESSAIHVKTNGQTSTMSSIYLENSTSGGGTTAAFNKGIESNVIGSTGAINAAIVADASNGRKNFAFVADNGFSTFMTTGDTTNAIVGIGPGTTSYPSLHIEEGVAPTSPVDGDMWYEDDSLYFRSGSVTYNLTHAFEQGTFDFQTVIDNGATFDKSNTFEMEGFGLTLNNSGLFRVYDSTATAVSIADINQGFDFMTYTGIVGDTVYNFTQDVANGIKLYGTDGTETHYFQVKGNGIFASGLVFNDGAALRNLAIDTVTGEIYTTALGSSSTPGIDDVLAEAQSLTATRSIDANSNQFSITSTTAFQVTNTQDGYINIQNSGFDSKVENSDGTITEQIQANLSRIRLRHTYSGGTSEVLIADDITLSAVDSTYIKNLPLLTDTTGYDILVRNRSSQALARIPSDMLGGGTSVSFGTDNQIPYMNSDGDDFDYSANLTFDGQAMVLTNTNAAFSTNYILTIAGEEGNDAAMLRLKGSGNRSAYIGLGVSDHMIFKNNHPTNAAAGFNFFNRLGASLASFTNSIAHIPFALTVNEAGGDFDFRVESDGDTHNIFSDGGTNQVGIGTSTLTEKLTVNGNVAASGGKVGASLVNNVTPDAVTGSSEEDLISYTLAAGKLAANGDYVEVEASFLVLSVSDKIIIKFGSTKVLEWTTGNTGTYSVRGRITRTGAATQEAQFTVVGEDSGVAITSPTETLSSALAITGAAQGVGSGDVTMYNLNVKYFPAN